MAVTVTVATRLRVRAAALAVSALFLLVPASAAVAAPSDDGLWYFDLLHVQDAHDAGLTGKGVTIAVLDTSLNPEVPTLAGADVRAQPSPCFDRDGVPLPPTSTDVTSARHGTNIVSLLVGTGAGYPGQAGVKGVAPDATILFYRMGSPVPGDEAHFECLDSSGTDQSSESFAAAIYEAIDAGADLFSVSMGTIHTPALELAMANAEHLGIPIVASLTNDQFNVDSPEFFGLANGVVSVQAGGSDGAVQTETSFSDVVGPGVGVLVQGVGDSWQAQETVNGTSLATPIVAGFLALVKQKYPSATGNQLIQTLIRNTGAEDHDLAFDQTSGYGFVSATHMLRVDPTQYDDVNPLIDSSENALEPSAELIANPPSAEEFLGADDGDGQTPTDDGSSAIDLSAFLLPALLALGGIVLVVVVIVIVLAIRRTRTASGPADRGPV